MIEIWRAGGAERSASLEEARSVEAAGWDGQIFMDSQSLCADPYARMGVWAVGTERIKLATGVTNPLTRHPAVTAASAAGVHEISGGRAVLGIGRGDSALAYLGYAPVRLSAFRRSLQDLQTLLSGGEVEFERFAPVENAPSLASMSLGDRPTGTALKWLPGALPKVPLDVAATGPKVIEMAATIAERVTFSVGANPERVRWAIDLARTARRKAGLKEDGLNLGLQVIVICDPDIDAVRELATLFVTPVARWQVMQGDAVGPQNESDKANFQLVRHGYDMNKHGDSQGGDKVMGGTLTWDFVERFAIVGPPDRCIERLLELTRLGIERFMIVGPDLLHPGPTLFSREVMPALRVAT